jgi:glycosyltransferase involved in cell wall biosynthesis
VLARVAERCAAHSPLVLAAPRALERVRGMVGPAAECRPWTAPPLSVREILPPPIGAAGSLLWVPHYNVPLLSRAPLVVTLHDVLPASEAGRGWPLAKRLAVRAWLAAIRSRAVRVMCDSTFTRDEAIRLASLDAGRMEVVPLGVDMPSPASTPVSTIPPYLLFVGLLKPHKNLRGLLRAFESILAEIPHRLVVVGRHAGLGEVDSEAVAMAVRLAPRVELIEDVSRERLASLMAGASLLVQPSFYEGFGLPPLEAMALGTPVLCARAASLPELCGDAALYFDPASHEEIARRIREVLADGALRNRMRASGIERAQRFTWDRCAARTGEILLEALGASPALAAAEGA